MKRALLAVVGIVIPILAFFLSNRREFDIGRRFARHELEAVLPAMVMFAAVAAGGALWWRARSSLPRELRAARALRFVLRERALLLSLLLIGAIAFVPAVVLRYRTFAETHYARTALQATTDAEVRRARELCKTYLGLYPQRRPNGAVPDPVCAPLSDFVQRAERLDDYVQARKPRVVSSGMRPDWNAFRHARWLMDKLAARENYEAAPVQVRSIEIAELRPLNPPAYRAPLTGNPSPSGDTVIIFDDRETSRASPPVILTPGESTEERRFAGSPSDQRSWSVRGVAADDVLNVRGGPGADQMKVGELPPYTTGVRVIERREVGRATWSRIEHGATRGWVNSQYLE